MNTRRVVFARTRFNYDSYVDFWRLVSLSNFEIVYSDEMALDDDGATYILTPINGEIEYVRERLRTRRAKTVWWNLERPDAPNNDLRAALDSIAGLFDAAWCSDRTVARMDARLTHVVLGGHKDLCDGAFSDEKTHDFATICYPWGRREALFRLIQDKGLSMAPSYFPGTERNITLARSRVMVNAHQYPLGVVAPLRFAAAAAHKLPVLTESIVDAYPHTPGVDLVEAAYDAMPDVAFSLVRDASRCAALGEAIYRTLCVEHTFRRGVEEALR